MLAKRHIGPTLLGWHEHLCDWWHDTGHNRQLQATALLSGGEFQIPLSGLIDGLIDCILKGRQVSKSLKTHISKSIKLVTVLIHIHDSCNVIVHLVHIFKHLKGIIDAPYPRPLPHGMGKMRQFKISVSFHIFISLRQSTLCIVMY